MNSRPLIRRLPRRARRACVPAMLLALAACSSAPIHFFTLVPATPAAPAARVAAAYRIAVLPVGVPVQVDQPQLVVRQSDNSVALLESERWIAPLGDEIRTVLAGELSRRLGAQEVYGLPHADDLPLYRIKLDVRRFESVPGRYALIDAAWSVRAEDGGKQVLSCAGSFRQPVDAGYGALVRGHQQALAALSAQVAASVRHLAAGDSSCPAR